MLKGSTDLSMIGSTQKHGLKRGVVFGVILFFLPVVTSFPQDLTITATQNLSAGTYNNLTINGAGIALPKRIISL